LLSHNYAFKKNNRYILYVEFLVNVTYDMYIKEDVTQKNGMIESCYFLLIDQEVVNGI